MNFDGTYYKAVCEEFPELFADGSSIVKVCVKIGIHRNTYDRWKKEHPEFKTAADRGEQISQAFWEDIAQDGCEGGKHPKFSAPMTSFILKNRFRKDYGAEEEAAKTNSAAISQIKDAVSRLADDHKKDA